MDKLQYGVMFVVFVGSVIGDMYLHNPRGSNNRLNEAGRQRNNGNRLFDSQNNDRGGYNVGSLYYYQGSKLPIEWTNQHSCKEANSHCEIVIQYMCDNQLRDGATTTTIPNTPVQCDNYDCNTDLRYGMHESFNYYLTCKQRERNQGLFTADQKLKGNKAIYTRQNAGGTRRGYECPEERDYYPYWHPSPWKDIAILTNDATRCPHYEEESENVKARWECQVPLNLMMDNINNGNFKIPNNREECLEWRWPTNDANGTQAKWTESGSHRIDKPICQEAPFSRDNHLGNGIGGYANTFNWTLPSNVQHENCAVRVRYNISTEDYDGWGVNATHTELSRGRKKRISTKIDLSSKYGFADQAEALQRGYEFKNNPIVKIFDDIDNFDLRLALNTAQYGRTFQDRSHSFAIRKRPGHLNGAIIHNVNVRGKRGNIVQVYPAVEYDFIPNTLSVHEGDYVHYQWTGSNNNPHNNDGQGRAGSDRSNVVLQGVQVYEEGDERSYYYGVEKYGHWGRSYPSNVKDATLLGFSADDMMNLALLTNVQYRGEMAELNDAGTYFDLGPRKVTTTGIFHYMCTRNNNFSNRSQKGRILATNIAKIQESIGWNGGKVELEGKAKVEVERGTFSDLYLVEIEVWTEEQGEARLDHKNRQVPVGDGYASEYISIQPEHKIAAAGKAFTVQMAVSSSGMEDIQIYRTSPESFATWTKVEANVQGSMATFATDEGGVYIGRTHTKAGAIAGAVIGVALLVGLMIGAVVLYKRKNPGAFSGISRSFAAKV